VLTDTGERIEAVPICHFAELVGVTEGAIRKAMRTGRLTAVVKLRSGRVMIDQARALQEWRASHPEKGEAREAQARRQLTALQQELQETLIIARMCGERVKRIAERIAGLQRQVRAMEGGDDTGVKPG